MPMSLSPEIKKQARQALVIKNSQVPAHRALDVLATDNGDVRAVLARYRDISEPDLRRALHHCAELLRTIEREAGLAPAWEAALQENSASPSASAPAQPAAKAGSTTPSGTATATSDATAPAAKSSSDDDLTPFVDESARGNVRVAKAYTDGASKGNPGQAGIGVVIFTMDGRKIAQQAKAIGIATNNIAEYSALIEAMTMARDLGIQVLNVISDSELMVRQVSGIYKIKNAEILKKAKEVMELKRGFEKFTISYVGREHNTIADALSTSLLKKKKPSGKKATQQADSGEYRDMLGPVDPDADEGVTE